MLIFYRGTNVETNCVMREILHFVYRWQLLTKSQSDGPSIADNL